MAERTVVDFIEDWQAGFFVVIGSAAVGVVAGVALRSLLGPPGFPLGFAGGGLLAFIAYAYLRYGR